MSGFRWTQEEMQILRNDWLEMSDGSLSVKLGKSAHAIRQKALKMDLPQKRRKNATEKDAVEYIKDMVGKKPVKQIAADLAMPPSTVYTILFNHDISVKAAKKAHTYPSSSSIERSQ